MDTSRSVGLNRDPDAVAGLRLLGLGLLHPHLSATVVLAARENLSWVEATTCALSFKSQCPKRWQKTVTLCRMDLSAPLDICSSGIEKATCKVRSNQEWNDGALGVTEDTTGGRGSDNSKV